MVNEPNPISISLYSDDDGDVALLCIYPRFSFIRMARRRVSNEHTKTKFIFSASETRGDN